MFIRTKEAAEYLNLSPRTLEKMRVCGNGPPFYKLGMTVAYTERDLEQWAASRLRRSTSDTGAHVQC